MRQKKAKFLRRTNPRLRLDHTTYVLEYIPYTDKYGRAFLKSQLKVK